jgi:peptidoglycan/xylan/chitin deacetylase (PgdA/CDA1 family)/uncharacterized caspase-like protein
MGGKPAALVLLALTAACRAAPSPKPAADALAARGDAQPIVERFRKVVVLLEAEPAMVPADQERARLVGWMLFQDNHARLEALRERLAAEASRGNPAGTQAFLDVLERDPDLWDADKLAFKDLVEDLRATLAELPQTSEEHRRLVARLDEDRAALAAIQALYDREIGRVLGRMGTRGMPLRRQSWEAYVAKLRALYTAPAILAERAADTTGITDLRAGPGGEGDLETSGLSLPPGSFLLTFDDGPHPRHTDRILEVLGRFGAPGVFFELGENLSTLKADDTLQPTRAASASRRLLAAGHVIGNHSFTHALLPKLGAAELAREIELTNRAVAGVPAAAPSLFRPPYGARNARVLAALRERGMKSVLWNVDSRDWADPVPSSVAERVVSEAEAQGRGIILFHDIHARTVEALPLVLETLQSRGYRFVGWNGEPAARTGTPGSASAPARAPAGPMYRESWAVVVGIDAYRHWPRLSYAANDARAVQDLLVRRYLFKPENVTLLLDEKATRESILAALGDRLADPARVSREDRVFVFFAGHGATRRLSSGRSLGYIVPVDADLASYQSQAISMTNFQDVSEAIPAKHVFFVTDACYSGVALTRGGPAGGRNYLEEVTRRSVRQMLTAGGADEEVSDNGPNGHSVFTWTLLQGLEGRADLSGDGYVTASELAAYVAPAVSSLSRQTPVFGSLPGSEGGDFVFELKNEAEYLSQESGQLDDEAIRLNTELDRIRAELSEKRARNERLRKEVEAARAKLDGRPAEAAAPAPPSRRIDRGTVLFREKRYSEALAEFEEASRLDPKSALAANNVGFTHYRLGDMERAISWFEKTLELDPNRAIAHANLGDALLAVGRQADARREYETFLRLQPNARYADEVRRRLAGLD